MTLYALIFYLLAVVIAASTALAVTRRNLVHAIIYLVMSFLGSAMLFYLFGAPLLAALQVIIYAGAIMVLFLFIVMMIRLDVSAEAMFPLSQLFPAALFGMVYLIVGVFLVATAPGANVALETALAAPGEFGRYVFQRHWLAVEIVSLLLLAALVGVLCLGARKSVEQGEEET